MIGMVLEMSAQQWINLQQVFLASLGVIINSYLPTVRTTMLCVTKPVHPDQSWERERTTWRQPICPSKNHSLLNPKPYFIGTIFHC